MNRESLELLEYEGVRRLIGRYVDSPLGKELLESCIPVSDRLRLERVTAETAEAIEYLKSGAASQPSPRGAVPPLRLTSLADPRPALARLRIEGAVLEGREIHELTQLLERAGEIRSALLAASERFPLLSARASRIADFRPLLRELSGKVLPGGELDDGASVALTRLRREIERQHKLIQASLERFLRAHREDGLLQEEFVTIRNERFVVPVVTSRKGRIDGVVHGASASGHTIFVEPLETIELNNELVRLAEEEAREVRRILAELTRRLHERRQELADAAQALAEIDFLLAKARFAREFQCVTPRFSPPDSPRLLLREARHPLLEDVLRRQGRRVTPLSLELSGQEHILLISGPNTGGKTVALKTVGVLALMAQSGFPVPASEAELPCFDQVLADIGDNQSIEQSLSTFSAHVARIREMLFDASPESLVLLDELGRATDPEEGSGLGIAILDRFRGRRAFVLASTHLAGIKAWGANTPGVLSASMGFDEQTLRPTYVLRVGAPGKSAGLEIASRLGLPDDLIEQARASMSGLERDIARLLRTLEERVKALEETEQQLRQAQAAVAGEEQKLRTDAEKAREQMLRELEARVQQALVRFDAESRELLNRLAESAETARLAAQVERRVRRLKREFREEVASALRASPGEGAASGAAGAPEIREGVRVRLKGVRQPGRILRLLEGGRVEVEAGYMRLQVDYTDILETLPEAPPPKPSGIRVRIGPAWNDSYREVNLIGKRVEEALEELDKFLDSASLASVSRVRIIHGHGLGKLKNAISGFLKDHPHVEKHYPAAQEEGGAGATIAELKE